MKLKTTNKIVFEQAKQHKDNCIELIGCDNLCKCDSIIENIVKENKICNKKNTFIKVFGLNNKFYYKISHRKNFSFISSEIGLGHLEKREDKIYLKRISVLIALEEDKAINTHGCCYNFDCNCDEEGMLIISNYNPTDIIPLLADKHCIISSIDEYVASPVHISKNSIVGRIEEDIQSIPIESLLNKIIRYDEVDGKVKFFNGSRWLTMVEEVDENTN
jgi:hypothetical protein